MPNILVIGNGFDVYHGYDTRYYDFVQYTRDNTGDKPDINDICQNNPFIKYFQTACGDHDNWIDCEGEIQSILHCLGKVFRDIKDARVREGVERTRYNGLEQRIIEHFKKYFDFEINRKYLMNKKYLIGLNIINDDLLYKELKKDLNETIHVLSEYLKKEMASKTADVRSPQIISIGTFDYAVNFNYTSLYEIYGINEEDVFTPHGTLKNEESIVFGIPDSDKLNLKFVYFKKFFQRIQKQNGILDIDKFVNSNVEGEYEEIKTYFFGMSMGKTDEDFIIRIMDYSDKTFILYYNQSDYEGKVINLIDILGREELERRLNEKELEFVQLEEAVHI